MLEERSGVSPISSYLHFAIAWPRDCEEWRGSLVGYDDRRCRDFRAAVIAVPRMAVQRTNGRCSWSWGWDTACVRLPSELHGGEQPWEFEMWREKAAPSLSYAEAQSGRDVQGGQ